MRTSKYPDVYIGHSDKTESNDYGIGRISGKQIFKLMSQCIRLRGLWQKILQRQIRYLKS
jgi:hypothetical protein